MIKVTKGSIGRISQHDGVFHIKRAGEDVWTRIFHTWNEADAYRQGVADAYNHWRASVEEATR